MKKDNIKQPEGGADEKTIEKNLKEMDYPSNEDITKQSEEIGADLEDIDE